MALFVEPLVTQHLWYWLKSKDGWTVNGEVDTGKGRIDLACKAPDGRYVGIELKADDGLSYNSELSEQLWRYIDSGRFDAVYFASPSVGRAARRLDSPSDDPLPQVIRNATERLRAGVQTSRYSAQEVLMAMEHRVSEEILSGGIQNGRPIRNFIRQALEIESESSVEPATLESGIEELSRSVMPPQIGLIEVPLPLESGVLENAKKALSPGGIEEPTIVREAHRLKRTGTPELAAQEEPTIRHAVWKEFGGLPEGSIPNVMETEQVDRPIDLVTFRDEWDPVRICKNPHTGNVIGVEVKGMGSYSPRRIVDQLTGYLEPGVFSRFYLAVPNDLTSRAEDLVSNHPNLSSRVGIIEVSQTGDVTVHRDAPPLDLQHDGYRRGSEFRKTGYGEVELKDGREVSSPFDLSEWRDPLKDPEGEPVVWNYDPRKTRHVIQDAGDLDVPEYTDIDGPLKPEGRDARTVRAYLLTGYSADPFSDGKPSLRSPKHGYVRLSVTDFETEQERYGMELHFGRGGWEGAYVCFIGEQVDAFVSVLSSLEKIEGASIPGRGKTIDLETFPFSREENYEHKLTRGKGTEERVELDVEATEADGVGAVLRIGSERKEGVTVTITETQRIDLLRTIRTMRYGRSSEIPGHGGYERVGPDGRDTWDLGTEIEKEHEPDYLVGSPPTKEEYQAQELEKAREEAIQYAENNRWGLHRNARREVGEILREQEHLSRSLSIYLEVAMLDVNGPRNRGNISKRMKKENPELAKTFDPDTGTVPIGVARMIYRVAEELGFDLSELKSEYNSVVEKKWRDDFELQPGEVWEQIEARVREAAVG